MESDNWQTSVLTLGSFHFRFKPDTPGANREQHLHQVDAMAKAETPRSAENRVQRAPIRYMSATATATAAFSMLVTRLGCSVDNADVEDSQISIRLSIGESQPVAKSLAQLGNQWKRIMVVEETHGFARTQCIQGAKNGGMTKASSDASGIKVVNAGVEGNVYGHGETVRPVDGGGANVRHPLTRCP
jgi:hypothetical protein